MAIEAYLDLLIRALNGELSDEVHDRRQRTFLALNEGQQFPGIFSLAACRDMLDLADQQFKSFLQPAGKSASEFLDMDERALFSYLNWMNPVGAPDTMCGRANLETVRTLMQEVLGNGVAGDFIETGVWKGGMTVLMRGVLKAHGITDRSVWLADSFEGLPEPDPASHLKDAIFRHLMAPLLYLGIPMEYVELTFDRYGLLDDQVKFLKGWFKDTLPAAGIKRLALARLDGDLYESTHDALTVLYPLLSSGGYIIIDDYGVPCGCRQAVDEFRTAHGIEAPLMPISEASVYWHKG